MRFKQWNGSDFLSPSFFAPSSPRRFALNRVALAPLATLLFLSAASAQTDRSPVDLVLAPDESWLATVNQTANTVSLVRTSDGRVLDEAAVGRRPVGIALASDGKTLLVSGHYSGEVTLLSVQGEKLVKLGAIDVGYLPHGIAIAPDGRTAYVACTASAEVAVVDLNEKKVTARIAVGRWPRYLALSTGGQRLIVGTSGDRGVTLVDCSTRKIVQQEQFVGLNIGHFAVTEDGHHAYFPWMVYRNNSITPGNIRLGWVLASRIGRVRLDEAARREAMSLDPQGRAIADVEGIDLTSDDQRLVVSAAGTHELLVYQTDGLPLKDYGGTDHIDPALLKDKDRFFRIELGGRPMGLQIAKDDKTVYIANYLDNSVQVVDLAERKLVRTLPLGGAAEPSLTRQGEAIFYDARRSLDQWYSCHTCHYEGGTNSVPTDTTNDGTAFTFKTVLPLYNLTETGPWTWHGWQTDLNAAMHKSLTETMLGPKPAEGDADALLAFLQSLELPPNPFLNEDGSLSAAAERGKAIFAGERAACASCHSGPYFTDGQIHDVGLGSARDRYKGYNTPSLRGLYQRVKLLHDGRVETLAELLTGSHAPEKVAGSKLTEDEVKDLVEYLKSL